MARKVSLSNQNLSIDEIVYYKQDLEKAIRLYYESYEKYEKFYTYTFQNITEEKTLRLEELELNAIFMMLSSVEAIFRIDFNLRVNEKLKDGLSKEFRSISKNKRNYSASLGFCSLARREKRRIRSIWFICEDSSIAATPLEGKRRGVLSSYKQTK